MFAVKPNRQSSSAPLRVLKARKWCANAPRIRTRAHAATPVLPHKDRDLYLEHVEKHFAKPEALRALAFAMPSVAALPEFASDRSLIRALRCAEGDERSVEVLNAYLRCAHATLEEAQRLGWIVCPNPRTTIAFATSGLLAVIETGVLRTLFFPGLECADARANRLFQSKAEVADEQRRDAARDDAQRHYYRVFRPALQLIRAMPDNGIVGSCSQSGALKRVLPSSRSLSYEGWLDYRQRSSAAEIDEYGGSV